MAGHSHWKQIQQKKGSADQKRGQIFSKLLRAISAAAKQEPNPDFNPRLRSAIETAKQNNVPNENIERAVKKASEEKNLEDVIIEAYGTEKAAIIIEAITDNKNRTISEIRNILNENGAKMAEQGSVLWSFEKINGEWQAKFHQPISEEGKQKIKNLIETLESHDDVQKIITNTK